MIWPKPVSQLVAPNSPRKFLASCNSCVPVLFVTETLPSPDAAATCPALDRPGCACGSPGDPTGRQMLMLQELAELGMDLARTVRARAVEQGPSLEAGPDLGLMFSRIARAVRQTLALEAKLYQDRQARHDKARAERAVETRLRGIRRKAKAVEIVERVVEREPDAERLLDALDERLEDEDDTDFADRPLGELVARICRDLGVAPDWDLWADEDWAIEARGEPPAPPDAARPPAAWPAHPPPDDPPSDEVGGQVGWNSA